MMQLSKTATVPKGLALRPNPASCCTPMQAHHLQRLSSWPMPRRSVPQLPTPGVYSRHKVCTKAASAAAPAAAAAASASSFASGAAATVASFCSALVAQLQLNFEQLVPKLGNLFQQVSLMLTEHLPQAFVQACPQISSTLTEQLPHTLGNAFQQVSSLNLIAKVSLLTLSVLPVVILIGFLYSKASGSDLRSSMYKMYLILYNAPGGDIGEEPTMAAYFVSNAAFVMGLFTFAVLLGIGKWKVLLMAFITDVPGESRILRPPLLSFEDLCVVLCCAVLFLGAPQLALCSVDVLQSPACLCASHIECYQSAQCAICFCA